MTLVVYHISTLSAEQREELQRLLRLGIPHQETDESVGSDRVVIANLVVTDPTKAMKTFLTLFRMLPRRLTKELEYDVTFHFAHKEV